MVFGFDLVNAENRHYSRVLFYPDVFLDKQVEPAVKEFNFCFTQMQAPCQGCPAGNATANLFDDCKGVLLRKEISIAGLR